jgi:putative membrane protein
MNTRRTLLPAVLSALSLAAFAPNAAFAAPTPADRTFVIEAGQGGLAEVSDGKLALAKSKDMHVRAVAQRMVTDHTAANKKLMMIAKAEALTLPLGPSDADHAMLAKHESLSGAAFNSAYLHGQTAAHEQTIAIFKKEIASGSDPKLVAFAKMTLPTIESHLAMITAKKTM